MCRQAVDKCLFVGWWNGAVAITARLFPKGLFIFHPKITNSIVLFSLFSISGLRYEDLLNEYEPAVAEALSYAPKEVVQGRTRRLKRAFDLSYKRKSLLDYAPDMVLEPFKQEIIPDIKNINERNQEWALMNIHNK